MKKTQMGEIDKKIEEAIIKKRRAIHLIKADAIIDILSNAQLTPMECYGILEIVKNFIYAKSVHDATEEANSEKK